MTPEWPKMTPEWPQEPYMTISWPVVTVTDLGGLFFEDSILASCQLVALSLGHQNILVIIIKIYLLRSNIIGSTEFVDLKNYTHELALFQYSKKSLYKNIFPKIPIGYKEINSILGKCFYLYTEELATTEQNYQGLTI